MSDPYDRYLIGVGELLKAVEPGTADHLAALTLQGRLAQSVAEARLYGSTETTRAEVARVTSELDRMCLAYLGRSFGQVCGTSELPASGSPTVYHNLPNADYGRFIGRRQELTTVYGLLVPTSRHFLVTIDGVGGVGKSALALEAAYHYLVDAHRLPVSERFDAIVWTSAKRTSLSTNGIVQRRQALHTLDDIYTAISVTLGRQDITRAQIEHQHEIVRKALTQLRVLLLVDNLEAIDDETVIGFLRELPVPTKAIVTTRHRIDVAYPIRLLGMPWESSRLLIKHECKKKGAKLTSDQERKLFDRTGGVPLAIVWSIGQVGLGHPVESVLARVADPSGDVVRFCFEGAMERIRGSDAHKLLMALALFSTGTDRETLGYIAGLSDDVIGRDEGLVELERLSQINKQGSKFSMLPLTRSYALHELELNPTFTRKATRRWAEHLAGLFESSGNRFWIQDQRAILQEGDNLLSVIDWATSRGDIDIMLMAVQPAVLYLQYTGRRVEALKLASNGIEAALQQGEISISAWLNIDAGWILSQQRSNLKALQHIRAGLAEYRQLGDEAGICFAECFLAQVLRHTHSSSETEALLDRVRAEAIRLNYLEGLVISEFELGKLARDTGDWSGAYSRFSKAREILETLYHMPVDIFSLAIQGNFASAAQQMGYYLQAKEATQRTLIELEKWRDFGVASSFTGRMNLQLAEIEAALGDRGTAAEHAEKALRLARMTKDARIAQQAQELIENLREGQPGLQTEPGQ